MLEAILTGLAVAGILLLVFGCVWIVLYLP